MINQNRTRPDLVGTPQVPEYRDYPYHYMMEALKYFKERKGKVIIEIGSMRRPLEHPIDIQKIDCCMDGHSSVIWAANSEIFYSIDIDPACTALTNHELKKFDLYNKIFRIAENRDGLEFLEKYQEKIDLLFLDAWDVDLENSEEKHLEAYLLAKKNLHGGSLILIDDTDVCRDTQGRVVFASGLSGKGRLVIPRAVSDGYKVVFTGRQTLLMK